MTRLDNLRALYNAVKDGRKCHIPSPYDLVRVSGEKARIMAYVEGYAVLRHKGAMPFVWQVKDILTMLAALIAQEEAKMKEGAE